MNSKVGHWDLLPLTTCYPCNLVLQELQRIIEEDCNADPRPVYIVKPDRGCQGNNIYLTDDLSNVKCNSALQWCCPTSALSATINASKPQ